MPSFTFGEEVGSTLSIRGRPLVAYPISSFHDLNLHDAHLLSKH